METQELSTKLSNSFFSAFCPDPTVMYDLGRTYDEYNQTFFYGELPELVKTLKKVNGVDVNSYNRVKWDGRMKTKTLGTYSPTSKRGFGVIRISRKIADDPVRAKSVLLHEMVHAYLDLKDLDDGINGHGSNFIDTARRINIQCQDKNIPVRVHFFDKEILEESPILFSELVQSKVFCTKDLDFARTAEKVLRTTFCEGVSVNY